MNKTRADERASSSTYQVSYILSGLYYTVTNTLSTVYLQSHLQNLYSLLQLTIDEYVRTNIPPSRHTVYSLRRPIEYIPCTYPRVPLVHRLQYCYIILAMQHVDGPSAAVTLVSSSQYCSPAGVLLSTKSDRITVLPLCTPISVLLNHVRDVIRQQNVHNR